MLKSCCVLVWEFLAKGKFPKELEWESLKFHWVGKATCTVRAFKAAAVMLLEVTDPAKISLMFSMSEKLSMERLSLLLY